MKKWKKISRKVLLDHPRMRVVEDTVELPSGAQTDYVLHDPDQNRQGVTIIALNEKDELLVQREYSYPPNEVMWQLPGGGVLNDESLEDAARRELSEESSYTADNVEIIGWFYWNNRRSNTQMHVAICSSLSHYDLPGDQEEDIESHWLSIDDVKKMVANGEVVNMAMLAALNLWWSRH